MDPEKDIARGLARLEGHLLWNAEVEEARREARCFTDALPWLTTAQREDVERVYTADRVAVSRAVLRRICARAAELRTEYDARYRSLRARGVAVCAVLVAALGGTCTAVTFLFR
ncbi:hypothetical protein AB0L71_12080 [Streptomyces sp. NPDC052052]|uniref:hypothetical protein n=1 Tax=Streptomyces sp. NPDC052052 TaxID=3154756 RepID=UPI00344A0BF2